MTSGQSQLVLVVMWTLPLSVVARTSQVPSSRGLAAWRSTMPAAFVLQSIRGRVAVASGPDSRWQARRCDSTRRAFGCASTPGAGRLRPAVPVRRAALRCLGWLHGVSVCVGALRRALDRDDRELLAIAGAG